MAIKKIGYGQVEPNQLSGIKTGQIYASLPLDPEVKVLENGAFMLYNYGKNMVNADEGDVDSCPEPYLVYNEIKIYEDWLSYKDFAMIRVGDNYVTNRPVVGNVTSANTDNTIYGGGSLTVGVTPSVTYPDPADPDVEKTLVGHTEYGYRMDGIVPRLVKTNVGDIWTTNMVDAIDTLEAGQVLGLATSDDAAGFVLTKGGSIAGMQFVVAKVYTMPDGQPGVKVQRIK